MAKCSPIYGWSTKPTSRTAPAGRPIPPAFGDAVDQLNAYFAGELTDFELELDLQGTEFQRRVWQALLTIPFGETRSYGEIAEQIGAPGAARAVGLANGHNPIAIIVPCHRVIGASGSLTGYGGGLDRKRSLLALEMRRSLPDVARCSTDPPEPRERARGRSPGQARTGNPGAGAPGKPSGNPGPPAPGSGNGMFPLATEFIHPGHCDWMAIWARKPAMGASRPP